VKTGQVSWEFRPFLLFPSDPGIGMLVRCQGPQASFLLTDQLYAQQREWATRMQSQQDQVRSLPTAQQPEAYVRAGGLDQFFRQRGMPEAKIESCLADQAMLNRLVEITDRGAKEFRVQGTPTFFINGEQVENAGTWEALEPKIREAL
jgi:protein-disulfide isomerase